MNKRNILLAAGAAALAVGLIALPGTSRSAQEVTPPAAPRVTPPQHRRR